MRVNHVFLPDASRQRERHREELVCAENERLSYCVDMHDCRENKVVNRDSYQVPSTAAVTLCAVEITVHRHC